MKGAAKPRPILAIGIPVALLAGCEQSAPSPPEAARTNADGAAVTRACRAGTYPVLLHEIDSIVGSLVLITPDTASSLPLASGGLVYGSTWSPNGRIVALRRRAQLPVRDSAPTELVLLAVDGTEEAVLFEDSTPYANGITARCPDGPTWSPDAKWLAFASQREADDWRIWAIAPRGGQPHLLMPELDVPHFYPRWSPRSAALMAYVAIVDGQRDLFLIDWSANAVENLTQGRVLDPEGPRWSADGRFIAFSAENAVTKASTTANRDIYVLEVGQSALHRITDDPNVDVQPAWSPAGTDMMFSSNRARAAQTDPERRQWFDVWIVSLDSGMMTPTAPPTLLPAQSPFSMNEVDWYPGTECGP